MPGCDQAENGRHDEQARRNILLCACRFPALVFELVDFRPGRRQMLSLRSIFWYMVLTSIAAALLWHCRRIRLTLFLLAFLPALICGRAGASRFLAPEFRLYSDLVVPQAAVDYLDLVVIYKQIESAAEGGRGCPAEPC